MDTPEKGIGMSAPRSVLTFDEMVRLKALGHQLTDELRLIWRARTAAMTDSERKIAEHRMGEAFGKIAIQFGKSRRLVIDDEDI
ncbi:hypothetical protein [Pseudomonas sp. NA-150]|uniref:hypothetical protein n=1 Tax=Pseudomonas sp. NA-150 TaxID=3367525 RepID=UPI0037C738B5